MQISEKIKLPRRVPTAFVAIGLAAACVLSLVQFTGTSAAAGDAYFILSPSSGSYTVGNTITLTVSLYSTSGDNLTAAQANLSYPTSQLQYVSQSISGPFDPNGTGICGQHTGGSGSVNIGCASTSGPVASGTQTYATITFTATAAGSPTISMTSGSDIDNNGGSSIWDGNLKTASYTLNSPVSPSPSPSPTPSPTPSPSPSPSSSGTGSSSKGSSGSTSKPSTSPSPSPSPSPTPSPTPATSKPSSTSTTQSTNNATVTITVLNSQGKPVQGAKVVLDNTDSVYTDAAGKAGFSDVQGGSHGVVVTSNGTKKTESVSVVSGQSKLVSVTLPSGSSSLVLVIFGVIGVAAIGGAAYWFFKIRPTSGFGGPSSTPPQDIIIGSGTNTPIS